MSNETTVDDPIAKDAKIWVVVSEGTIHSYQFVAHHTNYRGEPMLLLKYGNHPKQRNYYPAKQCHRSRQSACVAAAKTLRYRAEVFLSHAKDLEAEAAGIPWIPKGEG
jgi:hypothetical protein